jgi:alkanesulfonate monooxygenase SsuD/methylene tetrahydromethanopterin reductase-like flavin-dependent oxidoreductase (luciferase family)
MKMAHKLTMGVGWEGRPDFNGLIERAKLMDEVGVHSIWLAEAWGHDAFTLLTLVAEHTKKIQIGTFIVNIYGRTPGAYAQHFGTLDILSKGRMIIGLGTTSANVAEHFHGVKFQPAVTRMREYIDIINLLMAEQPLKYEGKLFKLQRGFTLRFETERKHIPIFVGAMNPKSVELTAQKADGWFPVDIPLSQLGSAIGEFRGVARAAGRDPMAVDVMTPGSVIITRNVERAKTATASGLAFYAGRMGTFYSTQLTRYGFGDEVAKIKQAWDARDAKGATAAVSPRMLNEMCYVTEPDDLSGARERLAAQEAAGATLHRVEIVERDPAVFAKIVEGLSK